MGLEHWDPSERDSSLPNQDEHNRHAQLFPFEMIPKIGAKSTIQLLIQT